MESVKDIFDTITHIFIKKIWEEKSDGERTVIFDKNLTPPNEPFDLVFSYDWEPSGSSEPTELLSPTAPNSNADSGLSMAIIDDNDFPVKDFIDFWLQVINTQSATPNK